MNLDLIEMKHFCASKDIFKKVPRQLTGWEKIFLICICDKWLVSRMYKEVLFLNNKKTSISLKNGHRIWIETSPKKIQGVGGGQWTHKNIREMPNKTTVTYHFTPTRMTIIQEIDTKKCWMRMWRKRDPQILMVRV